MFELLQTEGRARRGRLVTRRGVIDTPGFMPVGTQGSVKAASPRDLRELGAQIILGNTYHLFVRPGIEVIRHFGGLHRFMNWPGPILTDSGGYQVFSLGKLRRISEEGVLFQNHLDGAPCFLSPETSIEMQAALDSEIAMVFDECPPAGCGRDYAAESLELTLRWARRSHTAWQAGNEQRPQSAGGRLLFGIVQGSTFADLRQASAQALVEIGFDGYAIGGISVGEAEPEMLAAVDFTTPHLPPDKPRYAMGLGTPPQMLEMIARGVDLFDCVLPTRLARNGTAFTASGVLHLKNSAWTRQTGPIEEGCTCYACREFARGYIRHLIKANEILGLHLVTLHNLHFYLDLMRRAREAIAANGFEAFRKRFVTGYNVGATGEETDGAVTLAL